MPLPKPPTKRADMLTTVDFESQPKPAVKPAKRVSASKAPARLLTAQPPVLELVSGTAAEPARGKAAAPRASAPPEARLPQVSQPVAERGSEPAANDKPAVSPTSDAARNRAVSGPTRRRKATGPAKLFVLDTNVLLHDPMSLFRFEEHDIYLPMITLEELDGHKKGMTEVARNARQVSRDLDALAVDMSSRQQIDPASGIELAKTGHAGAGGKLYFQTSSMDVTLPMGLPQGKADNQILGVVQALRDQHTGTGREVVLVSKDINMRIKARALGLPAEDYFNDKTLDDGDLLYTGVLPLPADFWERHAKGMESWQQSGITYYRLSGPMVPALLVNQFVFLETPGASPWYGKVTEITGKTATLKTLKDFTHAKNAVWGVAARNREQNFA
ncbi:MAG: PhoH family protein, partial [Rubrivivax sp.]